MKQTNKPGNQTFRICTYFYWLREKQKNKQRKDKSYINRHNFFKQKLINEVESGKANLHNKTKQTKKKHILLRSCIQHLYTDTL